MGVDIIFFEFSRWRCVFNQYQSLLYNVSVYRDKHNVTTRKNVESRFNYLAQCLLTTRVHVGLQSNVGVGRLLFVIQRGKLAL